MKTFIRTSEKASFWLRRMRIRRGYTQRDLAFALGISNNCLSRYCTGKRDYPLILEWAMMALPANPKPIPYKKAIYWMRKGAPVRRISWEAQRFIYIHKGVPYEMQTYHADPEIWAATKEDLTAVWEISSCYTSDFA